MKQKARRFTSCASFRHNKKITQVNRKKLPKKCWIILLVNDRCLETKSSGPGKLSKIIVFFFYRSTSVSRFPKESAWTTFSLGNQNEQGNSQLSHTLYHAYHTSTNPIILDLFSPGQPVARAEKRELRERTVYLLFIYCERAETNDFSAIEKGSKSLWVWQVKATTIECQCFLTMSSKNNKLYTIDSKTEKLQMA